MTRVLKSLVIVPARLNSSRFPKKVLQEIDGKSILEHIFDRVIASGFGQPLFAIDDMETAVLISSFGGTYIMTDPELKSGTDRIYDALVQYEASKYYWGDDGMKDKVYDVIINLQGDMPIFNPDIIKTVHDLLYLPYTDVGTLCCNLGVGDNYDSENCVKMEYNPEFQNVTWFGRYYTQAKQGHEMAKHVGIYAYKREALERFCNAPQSESEKTTKLEQLRLFDGGMKYRTAFVYQEPKEVNVPKDLEDIISGYTK